MSVGIRVGCGHSSRLYRTDTLPCDAKFAHSLVFTRKRHSTWTVTSRPFACISCPRFYFGHFRRLEERSQEKLDLGQFSAVNVCQWIWGSVVQKKKKMVVLRAQFVSNNVTPNRQCDIAFLKWCMYLIGAISFNYEFIRCFRHRMICMFLNWHWNVAEIDCQESSPIDSAT